MGEAIVQLFPIVVLFCGIAGLMSLESYILTYEKHVVYSMLALSFLYYVAQFFESRLAMEPIFHYGRTIFAVAEYIIIPFIPILFFYLVVKPGKWAKFLFTLPIVQGLIFIYSLFSQLSTTLPNLGIEFTFDNKPYYGILYPISFISQTVPLALTLVLVIIKFVKHKTPVSNVVVSVFLILANALAWVLEKTVAGTYLLGLIAFLSATIYYVYLYVYYYKVHQEEVLRKSEIDIMMSQIHPHFLYNTLNSIYYLCGKDDELAKKTIDDFSTYLRLNLRSLTNKEQITVEEELHHVETYLNIEKLRFGDRLNFDFQIEAVDFKVPALILQPIVENAVKHGVCAKETGGTVTVKVYREENHIIMMVIDDGVGFDVSSIDWEKGDHVGFANTKKRVEMMMNGTLTVDSEIGKGTTVTIKF